MPRVVHFEIHGTDPARLVSYYKQVFDWQFNAVPGMDYWLIATGDEESPGINGGLMKRHGPRAIDGQPVHSFVCTIDVPQIDQYLARALEAGGTLALAKMAIPTIGWQAYVKDPDGNIFGLHQTDPTAR